MNSKHKLIFYSTSIITLLYGLFTWNYISMGAGIVSLVVAELD